MKALILRFDAPMVSFGGVTVDQHGFTDSYPGQAMLTGLIANALGWHHGDFHRLENLQGRLDYAARWDVEPIRSVDYHTVDLGSSKMRHPGWTTRGRDDHRTSHEDFKYATHLRYRHYWEDGLLTVALTIQGHDYPALEDILRGLRKPARPLFIGRKTCLPSRPLLDPHSPMREGEDLVSILQEVPVWDRFGMPHDSGDRLRACWSAEAHPDREGHIRLVYDLRDWANQLPAGSRWRCEGFLGGAK